MSGRNKDTTRLIKEVKQFMLEDRRIKLELQSTAVIAFALLREPCTVAFYLSLLCEEMSL